MSILLSPYSCCAGGSRSLLRWRHSLFAATLIAALSVYPVSSRYSVYCIIYPALSSHHFLHLMYKELNKLCSFM